VIRPPVASRRCSGPSPVYAFPTDWLLLRPEACLADAALPVTIGPVTAMDRSQNFGLLGTTVWQRITGHSFVALLAWISAGNLAS
jgi:hypothetical protein